MGYYIQTNNAFNKAQYLIDEDEAEIIPQPLKFIDVPQDRAIICVVSNPAFEAAAYCFNEEEFNAFLPHSEDSRPRTWMTMPLEKARELSRYPQEE